MAVGSEDLLDAARVVESVASAAPYAWLLGTSARAGVSGVLSPRQAAAQVVNLVRDGRLVALLFGGERTGLRRQELAACNAVLRIPMVGNDPSLNLAQSVMIVLYELLVAVLQEPAPWPSR
jgi:tRNA C32,U32 (ribose-2'-O)-methylase TrmJ